MHLATGGISGCSGEHPGWAGRQNLSSEHSYRAELPFLEETKPESGRDK